MKTFKVISILLLSSGMLLFTNCGLKKMVKKQTSVSYSVTPNPLETHGGKMTMEIQGNFPKKYFNKKATLSLVPVIKTSTGETTTLQTINLEGEKVNGNNTVIGYKSGGKFTITQTIDYKPAYQTCELMLTSSAKLKTKEDLKPGMMVNGIITNITNFGAFVDIEIKSDGLIQISQLSDNYVKQVQDVVSMHQQIKAKVIEIDLQRNRISLSLKDIS